MSWLRYCVTNKRSGMENNGRKKKDSEKFIMTGYYRDTGMAVTNFLSLYAKICLEDIVGTGAYRMFKT